MNTENKDRYQLIRPETLPLCPEQQRIIEAIKDTGAKLISLISEEKKYALDMKNAEKANAADIAITRVRESIFWGTYAVSEPEVLIK